MKKYLFIFIALVMVFGVNVKQAQAFETSFNICNVLPWLPQCQIEPSPTPTPSPEPTVEPTPTPEPSVEPSEEPTSTPEPSLEPEESSTPSASVSSDSGVSVAVTVPSCPDPALSKAMANFHVSRLGMIALVKWLPTEGDHAHIYYKESSSSVWQHSKSDIPNNGFTVIGWLVNSNMSFAGQQAGGCAVSPLTQVVNTSVGSPDIEGLFR